MELLISGIIGVLIMEAYSWLPLLCEELIEHAVRQVREKVRDRCREEWLAGLSELPNTLYRVAHSVSLVFGASRIREDSFEFEQFELNAQLSDVIQQHALLFEVLTDFKIQLRETLHERKKIFDDVAVNVRSLSAMGSDKGLNFEKFVSYTEDHCKSNVMTYQRAVSLSIDNMDRCIERLSEVSVLIDRMTASLKALTMSNGCLTLNERDALLAQVDSDLRTAKALFVDNRWGDDEAFAEAQRLFTVVLNSTKAYSVVVAKISTAVSDVRKQLENRSQDHNELRLTRQ